MLKVLTATKRNGVFCNLSVMRITIINGLVEPASSIHIHQSGSCIKRTYSQVPHRIVEHHSSSSREKEVRVIRSSILSHLVGIEYQVDLNKVLKYARYILSTPLGVRLHLLKLLKLCKSILIDLSFPLVEKLCNHCLPNWRK